MKQNQSKIANSQSHPSFQSKFKPPRPTIKVDYKVIHSNRDNINSLKRKQGKRIFADKKTDNKSLDLSSLNFNQQASKVKLVKPLINQYESGKFIESEYYPNQNNHLNESRNTCRKGKTIDAKNKYQQSKSLQNIIKEQNIKKREPSCFIGESRMSKIKTQRSSQQNDKSKLSIQNMLSNAQSRFSQRSKLPSYSSEGIKDIMEYEHAGQYREERVTPKCTATAGVNETGIRDKFRAFDQIHDFDFRKRVNTLSNQVRLTKGMR